MQIDAVIIRVTFVDLAVAVVVDAVAYLVCGITGITAPSEFAFHIGFTQKMANTSPEIAQRIEVARITEIAVGDAGIERICEAVAIVVFAVA